jgi:hypothetical protein
VDISSEDTTNMREYREESGCFKEYLELLELHGII